VGLEHVIICSEYQTYRKLLS